MSTTTETTLPERIEKGFDHALIALAALDDVREEYRDLMDEFEPVGVVDHLVLDGVGSAATEARAAIAEAREAVKRELVLRSENETRRGDDGDDAYSR